MMIELQHLSYSSISTWLLCGRSWAYHYIEKIPTKPSAALVMGSAFHNTVESFISGGHQGDITGLWREKWNAQLEADKVSDFDGASPEVEFNLGVRMFGHPDIQKGILSILPASREDGKPAIETRVELRVPGVPLPIVGYIDIMTGEGPADLKTSSKAWSTDQAQKEMQPLFYLAALNQMGKLNTWQFTHFVFTKTKTPQFQKITTVHKPAEVFWMFGMIKNVWKGIEAGVFPESPGSWKCSDQYCEYWNICRGKWL